MAATRMCTSHYRYYRRQCVVAGCLLQPQPLLLLVCVCGYFFSSERSTAVLAHGCLLALVSLLPSFSTLHCTTHHHHYTIQHYTPSLNKSMYERASMLFMFMFMLRNMLRNMATLHSTCTVLAAVLTQSHFLCCIRACSPCSPRRATRRLLFKRQASKQVDKSSPIGAVVVPMQRTSDRPRIYLLVVVVVVVVDNENEFPSHCDVRE